jgi:hypothetical protein
MGLTGVNRENTALNCSCSMASSSSSRRRASSWLLRSTLSGHGDACCLHIKRDPEIRDKAASHGWVCRGLTAATAATVAGYARTPAATPLLQAPLPCWVLRLGFNQHIMISCRGLERARRPVG